MIKNPGQRHCGAADPRADPGVNVGSRGRPNVTPNVTGR